MKHTYSILLALLLLNCNPLWSQGWIKTYYNYTSNYLNTFGQKTLDNGYIIAGGIGLFDKDIHLSKTDVFGSIQWTYTKSLSADQKVVAIRQIQTDGSYLVLYSSQNFDAHLLRVDINGQLLFDTPLNNLGMSIFTGAYKSNMRITQDNHLLISSYARDSINNFNIGLAKLDLSGNIKWSRLYHRPNMQSYSMDVIETPDNNYLLAGQIDTSFSPGGGGNGSEIHLIKTDTSGNDLWRKTILSTISEKVESVINTSDGGLMLCGSHNFGTSTEMLVYKLDSVGNTIWTWKSGAATSSVNNVAYAALEESTGKYTISGLQGPISPPSLYELAFIKLSAAGIKLSDKSLSSGQGIPYGKQLYTSANQGYSIFGCDISGPFIVTTDSMGNIFSNVLTGRVFLDLNMDCVQDIGEPSLSNRMVMASSNNLSRFGLSDSSGGYFIRVDSGSYNVEIQTLSPYVQACQNPQAVNFNGFYGQDTIDFALQIIDTCTFMQVDISPLALRRCFPSTYYVKYSNWGTQDAQNAYVEVSLDPYLTFDSSSIPMTLQTGQMFRFDLGTVPMMTSQLFKIYVTLDCDSTVLGQVHCTEAHIYPDTICIPNYWNGPILRTSSTCTNDTVRFRVENIGTNMPATQDFTIIEEHVMLYTSNIQLGSGQFTDIVVPAISGANYRIEVAQALGFPPLLGDSIVSSNHAACNTPIVITPNIMHQFYNGNSSPFISVNCQPNIGAFDPNDKQAQPLGYGIPHYINNNIPLHYHIRFQNTGTDTAFTVVVVDTLDAHLDPSSIKMGASSHNYSYQILEGGILVVRFDNIMLPDSNINMKASNGFFKFEIDQSNNNPVGTVIYNAAAIYFDYNAPIVTNRVFHTIGQDFIDIQILGNNKPLVDHISIKVFPNPFKQYTNIQVIGERYQQLDVQIIDLNGREIANYKTTNSDTIQIHRNNLPTGIYLYKLVADGQLINSGKIIAH